MAVKHSLRRQNPELLSMVGLGTLGGELRADSSTLESGIHLRWQMGESIGFPRGGFDLYRRRQDLILLAKCGWLLKRDDGGISWVPKRDADYPLLTLASSGESNAVQGCDQRTTSSVSLPGQQTLRLTFRDPVHHVSITFDQRTSPTPVGAAFWKSLDGLVVVANEAAQRQPTNEWTLSIFADHIDEVVLSGEDMVVCEICFQLVDDGYDVGWTKLPLNNPDPIYLPITHPTWGSPHPHAPHDRVEAAFRLPAGLSADKRQAYTDGFAPDLHQIIYDLVGTDPQRLYRISDEDVTSGAILNWPGLQLLKLTALDPNLARILGLYWHDVPPDAGQYYDYRIEGHYGDTTAPLKRYDYSQLVVGTSYGTILEHEGLRYTSPNPLFVEQGEWSGSPMSALFIEQSIPNAPLSISLPQKATSVTVYVSSMGQVKTKAYRGTSRVVTQEVPAGEKQIILQDVNGIDALMIEADRDLTIFEIALWNESLDDLVYVTFHHRMETPPPLSVPHLDPPTAVAARTGLDELGNLSGHQTSVGLRWNLPVAGGKSLRPGAPILYHVSRADLGNGEQPDAPGPQVILNEAAPVLVSDNRDQTSDVSTPRSYYTDRNLADGWYSYEVRGIDLFGRVGDWSASETIRALDVLPPPPPQNVAAQYLDPADPWLSAADQEWATADGPGLKVSWEWPGILRLQAPDVIPSAAEFRVYSVLGELNQLSGRVVAVNRNGHSTQLTTDIVWDRADNELAGEDIRVGNNFFPVTSNSSGVNCAIEVKNLSNPELVPAPGACTLVFGRDRSYWIDYAVTTNWEKRFHVEPVVDTPIVNGTVSKVRAFAEGPSALISHPGATHTVVTDQPFTDATGLLTPGALLCDGVVYEAYGHTLGDKLKIHIVPPVSPTDATVMLLPPANASFVYYPGQRYEVYAPGVELVVDPAKGSAVAQLAVSCCDGQTHSPDDPVWSQPKRGVLGGRPGNEGSLSTVCKVIAVSRVVPIAPHNVAVASDPLFAKPANYYGQAKFTLSWEVVTDAVGYAVYRCTGATLFDHDRLQRQNRKDYYATGDVFADDPGFASWLATYRPRITEDELTSQPQRHLAAWRAWADHFYPTLTDPQVQELANRPGNEKPLRRVNKDPVEPTSYTDTFDGRGRGFYLYRIRSIDTANNQSAWSDTYPPVHIYDVTPPASPVITAIVGGENQITIKWAKNLGDQISGYLVYRTQDKAKANDWRQMDLIKTDETDAYSVEVGGALPEKDFEFIDQTIQIRELYFYAIVAVVGREDGGQLQSSLSSCKSGQAYDERPPVPPVVTTLEWIGIDAAGIEYGLTAPFPEDQVISIVVKIGWQAQLEEKYLIQYKNDSVDDFANASSWLEGNTNTYIHKNPLSYLPQEYRILVTGFNGLFNLDFNVEVLDAMS